MNNDMDKLKLILAEWQERDIPDYIPREMPEDLFADNMIITFCGVRRSGKTYMQYQVIDDLLRQGVPKRNIVYINYEDDRLLPMTGGELRDLLDAQRQIFPPDDGYPTYLFLDEVQNISNWEKTIRRYHDTETDLKIVVTGSSSKLLSSEIAAALRGRTLTHQIHPLSFKKFLRFNNVDIPSADLRYSKRKNKILNLFDAFMETGSFPQVVLSEKKIEILREYYRAIFYRDIIERNQIRDIRGFEGFMKLVVQTMGSRFSIGKAKNTLGSIGYSLSKNVLSDYLSYMRSAFLVSEVPIFSPTVKDQMQYPRKIYLVDTGLYNAVSFKVGLDQGKMLENVVFNALSRKGSSVYYWAGGNDQEVDFVIAQNGSVSELIQVCYDTTTAGTIERERKSLLSAMRTFELPKGVILTHDEFGEEKHGSFSILLEPVWYRLLRDGCASAA